MITLGYFRRHQQALGGDEDVVLLDVAQEYVLEHLRRQGLFDGTLVFKGGTALRKFVFGASGRFSVDLDLGLLSDDPRDIDLTLDFLDGAALHDVRIRLRDRDGANAGLDIATPLGGVLRPARVSVRRQAPWLPPVMRPPQSFAFLDRGLQGEFRRAPLPVLDLREIAAEKIAAFWRRRHARDLYDLEHLGRVMQAEQVGGGGLGAIAELAALKIFFDVVEAGLSQPPETPAAVFAVPLATVVGAEDLGTLHASVTDVPTLLARCRQRYGALAGLTGEAARLLTTCSARDLWRAGRRRDELASRLSAVSV